MSFLACVVKNGEVFAASEYRDWFLSDGTTYETFFCPFCDVRLEASAIYKKVIGKSPHFRCQRGRPHISPCNGDALVEEPTGRKRRKPIPDYIEKSLMKLPEVLAEARREVAKIIAVHPWPEDMSPEERIRRRQREAGQCLGKARYRVWLVRSVADALVRVRELVLNHPQCRALPGKDRWKLLDQVLAACPLSLLEWQTTYAEGIRSPRGILPGKPAIYRDFGQLFPWRNGFAVKSERGVKTGTGEMPLYVLVNLDALAGDAAIQHQLAQRWARWARKLRNGEERLRVEWFALQEPVLTKDIHGKDSFTIAITKLEHLHLRLARERR